MFVTDPQHEFPVSRLSDSGARHWRMFRLSLNTLWFVLTVEIPDGDDSLKRTVCVAWDTDLVGLLQSLGEARAVALLCMTPGWCSATGEWAAHAVHEVWEAQNDAGDRVVVLLDERGHQLDDPSRAKPL